MRAIAGILAVGLACARSDAASHVVVPPRGQEPAVDLSRGGTERGDVELGLGVVTSVVAASLVGHGGYQAWRGVEVRRYCDEPSSFDDPNYTVFCSTPFGGDPFVAAIVSSSLSFAFAVPIAVAGGFLLRRGVLTRRAWRARQAPKLSVQPWPIGQRGGGVSLGVSF